MPNNTEKKNNMKTITTNSCLDKPTKARKTLKTETNVSSSNKNNIPVKNSKSNTNKNIVKQNGDHKTVECISDSNLNFNYEQPFDSVACDVACFNPATITNGENNYLLECNCNKKVRTGAALSKPNSRSSTTLLLDDHHIYDNLQAFELNLSKHYLLQRYFHSDARTDVIYENLCKGCGYGVFAAKGEFCNFCECILNGVESQNNSENFEQVNGNNNIIYENICELCGSLYNRNECDCKEISLLLSDLEINENIYEKSKRKIKKSKSFGGKRDKKSLLHNLFDTLKIVHKKPNTKKSQLNNNYNNNNNNSNSNCNKKPSLEIIHHIDGYDNVFKTQETFDLQKICELKRLQTSCSDQHIYGRLKSNENLSLEINQNSQTLPNHLLNNNHTNNVSHLSKSENITEDFNSKSNKKRRISKPRLLKSINPEESPLNTSSNDKNLHLKNKKSSNFYIQSNKIEISKPISAKFNINDDKNKNGLAQSVYLNDSICSWMSLLRYSIEDFNDFIYQIHPKSIPSSLILNNFNETIKSSLLKQVTTFQKNEYITSKSTLTVFPQTNIFLEKKKEAERESSTTTYTNDSDLSQEVILRDKKQENFLEFNEENFKNLKPVGDEYLQISQMVNEFKKQYMAKHFLKSTKQRELQQHEEEEEGKQSINIKNIFSEKQQNDLVIMQKHIQENQQKLHFVQEQHEEQQFQPEDKFFPTSQSLGREDLFQNQRSKRQAIYLKINDSLNISNNSNNNNSLINEENLALKAITIPPVCYQEEDEEYFNNETTIIVPPTIYCQSDEEKFKLKTATITKTAGKAETATIVSPSTKMPLTTISPHPLYQEGEECFDLKSKIATKTTTIPPLYYQEDEEYFTLTSLSPSSSSAATATTKTIPQILLCTENLRENNENNKKILNSDNYLKNSTAILQNANMEVNQMVSRNVVREAIAATVANKRSGIYERDSEFVNDLLNVFNSCLLQHTKNNFKLNENENELDVIENKTIQENSNQIIHEINIHSKEFNHLKLNEVTVVESNVLNNKFNSNNNNNNNNDLPLKNSKEPFNTINSFNEVSTVPLSVSLSSTLSSCDPLSPNNKCYDSCALIPSTPLLREPLKSLVNETATATATTKTLTIINSPIFQLPLKNTSFDLEKISGPPININIFEIFNRHLLSCSLNPIILFHDPTLFIFLKTIFGNQENYLKYSLFNFKQLLKKYLRFKLIYEKFENFYQINNQCSHLKLLKSNSNNLYAGIILKLLERNAHKNSDSLNATLEIYLKALHSKDTNAEALKQTNTNKALEEKTKGEDLENFCFSWKANDEASSHLKASPEPENCISFFQKDRKDYASTLTSLESRNNNLISSSKELADNADATLEQKASNSKGFKSHDKSFSSVNADQRNDSVIKSIKNNNSSLQEDNNHFALDNNNEKLESFSHLDTKDNNNLITKKINNLKELNSTESVQLNRKPPKIPQRDPKTSLSTKRNSSLLYPFPISENNKTANQESLSGQQLCSKMIVPNANLGQKNNTSAPSNPPVAALIHSNNNNNETNNNNNKKITEDEEIYQPIWKFKTLGEVQERYEIDSDYYEISNNKMSSTSPSSMLRNDDSSSLYEEDHNEWETDDEFMFTTHIDLIKAKRLGSSYLSRNSTIRSNHSSSSTTGSTITEFNGSSSTLASFTSPPLKHHLYRNICIVYSLSEPNLRVCLFDYERNNISSYFIKAAQNTAVLSSSNTNEPTFNDSGLGKSLKQYSPMPPTRSTSSSSVLQQLRKMDNFTGNHHKMKPNRPAPPPPASTVAAAFKLTSAGVSLAAPVIASNASSVAVSNPIDAWKSMLLNVNYMEDEEDLIVSENGILAARMLNETNNPQIITPAQPTMQRYKSASSGNLVDLPCEDDKKSIKERMRNKFQRGVLKLNPRSPKGEKKSRTVNQRKEVASLCLDEPRYPIFGVSLDQLELNQTLHPNVPRFVVDCVEYIELKDFIEQDGLYRASGNKVSIDELKKKLSLFYDKNLLITDDIHTLTSLLKQFFRELTAPLIPQEVYDRLGRHLQDPSTIESMRIAFDEMPEPNRSTLKFLIQHLVNVAAHSEYNRMPASNLAIVWGPCILSANKIEFDIGRMNTLAKVLIENYEKIFANNNNERLVS